MLSTMIAFILMLSLSPAWASQSPQASQSQASPPAEPASSVSGAQASPNGPALPTDYVIGADDVLGIVFWRDRDMSGDVVVRPDGKISLPLLNEIQAAGLTPEQLRKQLETAARHYMEDPTITVVVRTINSRKVFVTGEVTRPGPYPLTGPTTVLQIIATAGGLLEYADAKNIIVMRVQNGRSVSFRFNYKDVTRRKNLQQNIQLLPGDTIIVP